MIIEFVCFGLVILLFLPDDFVVRRVRSLCLAVFNRCCLLLFTFVCIILFVVNGVGVWWVVMLVWFGLLC